VAIAPEGTRSCGDRLGEFKKGPFHIAMQAGVPVVPIVIHNASDVLPKGNFFIRPTRVVVDVLEPVSTENWRAETVDAHVHDIRQRYLDALGQSDRKDTALKRVK
jgi:putative phosphoserine phosphatase/1-acylglycerol-3-phosphate O-acyltransferase